jgi:two-component system, NarL family, response regulator NreC
MQSLTLLLVDDHKLFRSGLAQVIAELSLFTNVFEAEHGREAIDIVKEHSIDLMMLDIDMPVLDGISVIKHLRKTRELPRTIVLTIYNDSVFVHQLIALGAHGYLSKNCDPNSLTDAVRTVLQGGIYYPIQYEEEMKYFLHTGRTSKITLSLDEIAIIQLMARGLSSKEIASLTNYTVRSVETKKMRIKKKLSAKSSAEVIDVAYKIGLLKV